MGRYENLSNHAVFSVDDSKDHRYAGDGYKRLGDSPVSAPAAEPVTPEANPAPAGNPGEPPRGGEGSGREAWAAHAATLGIELAEDATRDDIIAAVDAKAAEGNQP
jgi:hypothetical protein